MALLNLLLLMTSLGRLAAEQQLTAAEAAKIVQAARGLIQAGQISRARQLADEVRRQDLTEASIQNELGKVYEKLGDLKLAQEAYKKAVQLSPQIEDYYLDLVSLLFLEQQPREALELLKDAVHKLPSSYSLELALGTAYEASGEKYEALSTFERALRKEPDFAQAYVLYGKLASLLGQTETALEALRKASQIDPGDARARYYLGIALRKAAKPNAESSAEFRKAVEIDPTYAVARYELAKGLEHENKLAEAVAEYCRALKDDPSLGQIYYRLYESYRRLGQKEKAQEALKAFRAYQAADQAKTRPNPRDENKN